MKPTTEHIAEAHDRRALWLGIAVLVGAGVLRLLYLTDEGFWFDELWIWRQVQMSFSGLMADMVEGDVHPPLYQVIVWLWARIFGSGELALRLPSAVFGVLAVAAVMRLGRQLFGRSAGLWAGLALACNEYAVYYSQEARSYSLLLLLSVLAVSTWLSVRERASRGRVWAYGLSGVALAYTHVFGVLLLAYLAVVWGVLTWRGERGQWTPRRWFAVHVAMGLAFALWLPALWLQATRVQQGFWIPEPEPLFFATYFAKFAGHRALGLLALPLLGWVAWHVWGRGEAAEPSGAVAGLSARQGTLLLVGWFAFMLGVPYVVSVVGQPIMHAKSAISVVAPIVLVIGYGLALVPRRMRAVVAMLWVAASLWAIIATNYLAQNREAWREMTSAVEVAYDAERDLAVLYHPDYDYMFCYHYYLDPAVRSVEMLCEGDACTARVAELTQQADQAGVSRLWLLKVRASDAFPDGLDADWAVTSEDRTFNNGVLQTLERRLPR